MSDASAAATQPETGAEHDADLGVGDEEVVTAMTTATTMTREQDLGNDWATGYAEGKVAHVAWSNVYVLAEACRRVAAHRPARTSAWVDGFKTGWHVAVDG